MVVVTVFILIMNQTEHSLVHNQEGNCHYDHIPFNWKVIRNLFLWPYVCLINYLTFLQCTVNSDGIMDTIIECIKTIIVLYWTTSACIIYIPVLRIKLKILFEERVRSRTCKPSYFQANMISKIFSINVSVISPKLEQLKIANKNQKDQHTVY